MQDPQIVHRNMVIDLQHPNADSTKGPGNPIKLSRNDNESFTPAPTLGQHTDTVFKEILDMTAEDVDSLKVAGVVA